MINWLSRFFERRNHDNCCRNAVGVSDANIILDSFTREKSHYPVNALPSYDRLNGTREDGWCAELNDDEKWLQVDLEKVTKVYAVATQGDINGNEWVIYFKPAHSKSYEDLWPTYKGAKGLEVVRFGPKCPFKPGASNISWRSTVRFSSNRFELRNKSLLCSLIVRVRVVPRRTD